MTGVVFDSVHFGPLVDATINLEGSRRSGRSGPDGRFRIDSVPPGSYPVVLVHPLLDTLGVTVRTAAVMMAPGSSVAVEIAVPSAQRVVEISCAPAWRARGPSALVGKVLDADSDKPLVGAQVQLVWTELSLTDLRRVPRVREVKAGTDGTYRICGLPGGLDGTVQATMNGAKTAEVHVATSETSPLAFQSLRIGMPVAEAQAVGARTSAQDSAARPGQAAIARSDSGPAPGVRRGAARLTGKVVNAAGAPVVGARVDLEGTDAKTLTRENGEFALTDLPSGTQSLMVRQLGFEPVQQAVELSQREPRRVVVTMSKAARGLDPVVVTAKASDDGLDRLGFNHRKKVGMGYFMGPDEIAKRQALRMTDLFRTVPGLRVTPSGSDYVVESSRDPMGGCVRYVVDGMPYEAYYPGDVDRVMPPQDVGAIEVYNGSNTPAEFQGPGQSSCTTVVMWSRFRLESKGKRR